MSYKKAMKHHYNIKKCKKQQGQWMGFDCGSFNETDSQIDLRVLYKNISHNFKYRHIYGLSKVRDFLKDEIISLRKFCGEFGLTAQERYAHHVKYEKRRFTRLTKINGREKAKNMILRSTKLKVVKEWINNQ